MRKKRASMHEAKSSKKGTHKPAANTSHRALILWLSALLVVAIALSGWHPLFPEDWYVEHILVLAAAPVLWLLYRKLSLSVVSWVGIFLFLYIHELGAHFTYSKVPYDEWTQSWLGFSLNGRFGWERNHFDRLVHFTYGLLLAYPLKEIITGWCSLRGFWPWFFALDLVLSSSCFYELLEWAAALVFSEEVGTAYLGTQGDVWDAHKDILLAVIGGFIALTIAIVIESRRRGRVFWQEWRESLRVKQG
jgi:putative membrane protein